MGRDTALWVATAIAPGLAPITLPAIQQRKAGREMSKQQEQEKQRQEGLRQGVLKREKEEESQSQIRRTTAEARRRQKALTAGGGRAGTLLTSPLGLPGAAPVGKKTLLGA